MQDLSAMEGEPPLPWDHPRTTAQSPTFTEIWSNTAFGMMILQDRPDLRAGETITKLESVSPAQAVSGIRPLLTFAPGSTPEANQHTPPTRWMGRSARFVVRNWYCANTTAKLDASQRTTLPTVTTCSGTRPSNKDGHSIFNSTRMPSLISCSEDTSTPFLLMFLTMPVPTAGNRRVKLRYRTRSSSGKRTFDRRSSTAIWRKSSIL